MIKASEAAKQRQINEAEGEAAAIVAVADATADGLTRAAAAISGPGGPDAVQLKVAQSYIEKFGELAKTNNTMILPANVAAAASVMATAMSVINQNKGSYRLELVAEHSAQPVLDLHTRGILAQRGVIPNVKSKVGETGTSYVNSLVPAVEAV